MIKNEIKMESIKVYVVIGGYDYEGDDVNSLKIFISESSALDYKASLIKNRFDSARIEIKEIED